MVELIVPTGSTREFREHCLQAHFIENKHCKISHHLKICHVDHNHRNPDGTDIYVYTVQDECINKYTYIYIYFSWTLSVEHIFLRVAEYWPCSPHAGAVVLLLLCLSGCAIGGFCWRKRRSHLGESYPLHLSLFISLHPSLLSLLSLPPQLNLFISLPSPHPNSIYQKVYFPLGSCF